MAETKQKKPVAAKAAAKTEVKPAAKPEAKVAKQANPPAKAARPAAGATVTVTQTGSPIGRPEYQRQTLIGLGLNKRHRTRTLEDTPSVRGMIERVKHLVRVGEDK